MSNKLYKVVGFVLDDKGEYTRIEYTNFYRGYTFQNAIYIASALYLENQIEGVTIEEFKK